MRTGLVLEEFITRSLMFSKTQWSKVAPKVFVQHPCLKEGGCTAQAHEQPVYLYHIERTSLSSIYVD